MSKINIKNELLEFMESIDKKMSDIKCARIIFSKGIGMTDEEHFLKLGYKPIDMDILLDSINKIHQEFTKEEVNGYIWLKDGTWASRECFEGNEFWEYYEAPEIPKECLDD